MDKTTITIDKVDQKSIRRLTNEYDITQAQLLKVILRVIRKFKPELQGEVDNIVRRR